jgi:hypothetical protein
MRSFKSFTNYYSIHLFLFIFLLLSPSFWDWTGFTSLLQHIKVRWVTSSSHFLVTSQQENLYLQVVAGTGASSFNGENLPATSAMLKLAPGGVYGTPNGIIFIGDTGNHRIRMVDFQGIISRIVGTGAYGESGVPGTALTTDIADPYFITGDTGGSFLYFSDQKFIWKYEISNGLLTRYAGAIPRSLGYGGDNQQATTAVFWTPRGVSVATSGLLFIADTGNNRVRVIATNGIITTFAGSGPDNGATGDYGGDGGAATSTLCKMANPWSVYADSIGNVFIADNGNGRVRKVDSSGIIRTFAGGGAGGDGGPATMASISGLLDVKGDRLGNIYFANGCNIRMVNTAGIMDRIVGTGTCDTTLPFSPVSSAPINNVNALWIDTNLNIYFAESPGLIHRTLNVALPSSQPSFQPSTQQTSNPTIQQRWIRIIVGNGTFGYNGDERPATSALVHFNSAGGLYRDSNGILYIGDYGNSRVRKVSLSGIIRTIVGTGTFGTTGISDQAGTSVSVGNPRFMVGDTLGDFLYFSDYSYIWKYRISDGNLIRYGGAAPYSAGFNGDGNQATLSQFSSPVGIWLATNGLLFIADNGNRRIRVIQTNGIVFTFAGSGLDGFDGDGGNATSTNCKMKPPYGVYSDTMGNVYIGDISNNRIRKVTAVSNIITTFAGGGAGTGDGEQATSVVLTSVYDVKGDLYGNIFLADNCRIRMINTVGIINTIVGSSSCSSFTTMSSASLPALSTNIRRLLALWIGSMSDLYFCEYRGVIRTAFLPSSPSSQPSTQPSSLPSTQPTCQPSIQPSSFPTSIPTSQPSHFRFLEIIAGNGTRGYNGDVRLAPTALLNFNGAAGIYLDSTGVLFVGDYSNYRVRKISTNGIIRTIIGTGIFGTTGIDGHLGTTIAIATPRFITGDTMGNYLYISDYYYIWKFQRSSGNLTRYAGAIPYSPAYSGDLNQATSARFATPLGISLSTNGALFIADNGNHRIRVINLNGIINTYAGSGVAGFAGDNGAATSTACKIDSPYGVYVDTQGKVFIADTGNNRVRKVEIAGIIFTIAGGGIGGDGGRASLASLSAVWDVKGDKDGTIFLTDFCRIRMISSLGIIRTVVGTGNCLPTSSVVPLLFSSALTTDIRKVYGLDVGSSSEIYFCEDPGLIRKAALPSSPSSQPTIQPSALISSSSLKEGLVAYYPFDDGGSANDKSGNGNNGLKRGGVTNVIDRFGRSDGAVNFDGSTGYIEIVHGNQFNFVNNFSVCLWLNPNTSQLANSRILDKTVYIASDNTYASWTFSQNSNLVNSFLVNAIDHDNAVSHYSPSTFFTAGEWKHICVVKSNTFFQVFVHGLLHSFITYPGSPLIRQRDTAFKRNLPLIIGALNLGGTNPASDLIQFYAGKVDDIWIYNRSLSANEVYDIWNFNSPTSQPTNQPSRVPSSQPSKQPTVQPSSQPSSQPTFQPSVRIAASTLRDGLIGWYPFDGGNAKDHSGNGIDGLIRGGGVSSVADRNNMNSKAIAINVNGGSSSYIEFPGSAFNVPNALSISFWVKPAAQQVDSAVLLDKSHYSLSSGHNLAGFRIEQDTSNTNKINFGWIYALDSTLVSSGLQLASNLWNHVVYCKQDTQIVTYLNGLQVYSEVLSLITLKNVILSNGNKPLVLGSFNGGQTFPASSLNQFFKGSFDDLMIYNRSLSAAEVLQLLTFILLHLLPLHNLPEDLRANRLHNLHHNRLSNHPHVPPLSLHCNHLVVPHLNRRVDRQRSPLLILPRNHQFVQSHNRLRFHLLNHLHIHHLILHRNHRVAHPLNLHISHQRNPLLSLR